MVKIKRADHIIFYIICIYHGIYTIIYAIYITDNVVYTITGAFLLPNQTGIKVLKKGHQSILLMIYYLEYCKRHP